MIESTLDYKHISKAVNEQLASAGTLGSPGWFAGARWTFGDPDLGKDERVHTATAELIVLAHAASQQEAARPVGEFLHGTGRSFRRVTSGIAALRQTAMPLEGSAHPAGGQAVPLDHPFTSDLRSEEEVMTATVARATEGKLQRPSLRRRCDGDEYIAEVSSEVSSEVTQAGVHILTRGVAGPSECAWCAHRRLEQAVGSPKPFPTGWPRTGQGQRNYDELVTLSRVDRQHTFMTAYLREVSATGVAGLVQLLIGY